LGSLAASVGESFRTLGRGSEGLVIAVTGPVSSIFSRLTPKTSAALHAATSTHADAAVFIIEAGVITKVTLRRFYPLIKSS